MAHPGAAEIYRQSLGQRSVDSGFNNQQQQNCLRFRMNHDTNVSKHIGYGDSVSDDFICKFASNQAWILECVSKSSPWLSYRNYGIKSDNLSWMLTYQCLNSGTAPATWTVWVAPGTWLNEHTKLGIYRAVGALGFNPNQYLYFGDRCVYKSRLYTQRTCDCCTEANARYI